MLKLLSILKPRGTIFFKTKKGTLHKEGAPKKYTQNLMLFRI